MPDKDLGDWYTGVNLTNEVEPDAPKTWLRLDIRGRQGNYKGVSLAPCLAVPETQNIPCWVRGLFKNRDHDSPVEALAVGVYGAGILSMVAVVQQSAYNALREEIDNIDLGASTTRISDVAHGLFSVSMAGTDEDAWEVFIRKIIDAVVEDRDKPPFDDFLTLYIAELMVYAHALVADPHYPTRPFHKWRWHPRPISGGGSQTKDSRASWQAYDIRSEAPHHDYQKGMTIVRFPQGLSDDEHHTCLHRTLFKNTDLASPVAELAIGMHQAGNVGIVSLVAVPRLGVASQLVSALHAASAEFYLIEHEGAVDQRVRFGITTTDHSALCRFMEGIEKVASLDASVTTYFKEVLVYALAFTAYPDHPFKFSNTPWLWEPRVIPRHDKTPVYMSQTCNEIVPRSRLIWRYDPKLHADFPTEIPPLRRAILARDLRRVQQILSDDPDSIARLDPWLNFPRDLARDVKDQRILDAIIDCEEAIDPSCAAAAHLQGNLGTHYMYRNEERRKRNMLEHAEEERRGMPRRPFLHQAVINRAYVGEQGLERLQSQLKANHEWVNEQDPWGLTPVILAAATGQAEVLKLLFRCEASRKEEASQREWVKWGLLENASTPEVMKVILKNKVDPAGFTLRLEEAINAGDTEMIKVMLRYGAKQQCWVPKQFRTGQTPFDMAYERAVNTGDLGLLKMFLWHIEGFRPAGPYDPAVPHPVQALFERYNRWWKSVIKDRKTPPTIRIIHPNPQRAKIRIFFRDNHHETPLVSTIKSTADLNPLRRKQIGDLFDKNFERWGDDDQGAERGKYLAATFPEKRDAKVFVQFFKENGKLVSFFPFKVMRGSYQGKDFVLFYPMLAAVEESHRSMKLADFTYLIAEAIAEKEDVPVYVCQKLDKPGHGYVMLKMEELQAPPKYEYDEDEAFIRHLVKMTGEELLEGGAMKAKLRVLRVDRPADSRWRYDEFKEFTGPEEGDAVVNYWKVSPRSRQAFLNTLKRNGVVEEHVQRLSQFWPQFTARHDELCERGILEKLPKPSKL